MVVLYVIGIFMLCDISIQIEKYVNAMCTCMKILNVYNKVRSNRRYDYTPINDNFNANVFFKYCNNITIITEPINNNFNNESLSIDF